jgi:beta-glucosidase-like glycosyl hydrolase
MRTVFEVCACNRQLLRFACCCAQLRFAHTVAAALWADLRPWRDYAKAGGRGVMASHNMIDWIPCHANKKMLTDTLRDRFGLDDGYIGSDNANVEFLQHGYQAFADNASDAAAMALDAGAVARA